jgi:hypothetical protein
MDDEPVGQMPEHELVVNPSVKPYEPEGHGEQDNAA